MQHIINQVVQGFLSGGAAKAQAAKLYQESFDLDEIQSKAVCCGLIVPNWWLEFDVDQLEFLEGLLSPKRMEELASGAEHTARERKRYRAHRLSQVRNGDIDFDQIPGFWIHRIVDSNGDDLFALTTVTGYSFSFIRTEFQGLFLRETDCMAYLKSHGVLRGVRHLRRVKHSRRVWSQESKDQLFFLFPRE